MWSAPIERRDADGSPYHLVLLDTEGIDAYDQTGWVIQKCHPALRFLHTAIA